MCKVIMIDTELGVKVEIFAGTKFQCDLVADRVTGDTKIKGIKYEVRD